MARYEIYGTRPAVAAEDTGPLGERLRVRDAVALTEVRAGTPAVEVEIGDDDIVELQMEDGVVLYLAPEELPLHMGDDGVRALRPDGVIPLVPHLAVDTGTTGRGLGSWAVRLLRVLGVDPVTESAVAIAGRFEDRAVQDSAGAHGLHLWDGRPDGFRPASTAALAAAAGGADPAAPWLLFLHGTASSALGSFGKLGDGPGSPWASLRDAYGARILAFEHRTLTESPVQNAADLLEALPEGAVLHLVSHSRGGLVGEVLTRGQMADAEGAARPPFTEAERAAFDAPEHAGDRAALDRLERLLTDKGIRVDRFVRVACPAAGTSLMGDRLDRWLNLVLNALRFASGALGPVAATLADGLGSVVRALVAERHNPNALPGLEAMSAERAPLLAVLNAADAQLRDSTLCVIAGDIEGAGPLHRLVVWISDWYFPSDHDLVVDTASMRRGIPRALPVEYHLDRGGDVDHFSYFANPETARIMVEALSGLYTPAAVTSRGGAVATDEESFEDEAPLVSRHRGDQRDLPVVFLLPGITGTHLTAGGKRVWISPLRLGAGGLRRLDIDAADVRPDGLIGRFYGKLFKHLDTRQQVVAWPYDWRLSILETARRFADDLDRALAGTDRPVRIVAHSMGGLVARAAFALDPALWTRFRARDGARLVMLGTPNGGSFSIPMMLMGRDQMMRTLALIDLHHDAAAQLQIVARWPGVAQMLPLPVGGSAETGGLDLFRREGWEALARVDKARRWSVPPEPVLAEARRFRALLDQAPADPRVMAYVAGQSRTYAALYLPDAARPEVRFGVTEEGDGRVLWFTGIPETVPRWFTDAAHGDLARHESIFAGIQDLLDSGTTERIAREMPDVRPRRGSAAPVAAEPVGLIPDRGALAMMAMGGRPTPARAPALPKVRLRVSNAHLRFARHPLVIGHYLGDGLSGSEKVVDREQNGRLTRRMERGLHPGPLSSQDVHLDARAHPPGTLVVGLGEVSELSTGRLRQTLRTGLLALATAKDERDDASDAARGKPRGVTLVLIGAGGGVLTMRDSLMATLRALAEANLRLGDAGFDEVELIEHIEHRAIEAWHTLSELLERDEFGAGFRILPEVERGPGARSALATDAQSSRWTPITIRSAPPADGAASADAAGTLQYVVIAGRARAEAELVAPRRRFIENYVGMISAGRDGEASGQAARTLFELLWPPALKQHSLDDRSIRLILDAEAAKLPWEMLDDRRPWLQRSGVISERSGPPAVRHGVVRQLISGRRRDQILPGAAERRALVIGDPRGAPSDFAPLPGAEAEARAVARLLSDHGFAVTELVGATARPEDVVSALFSDAWQIIHIAAHGVFAHEFVKGAPRSGVVLGGKGEPMLLDAGIFGQLPVTPDLVFVNCCHLGQTGGVVAELSQRAARPELASSLSVELIENGTRAVVAAGWEVSDAGAQLFAEVFYKAMLRGVSYGEALRQGRTAIFAQGGDTTWGAYQAYGHPDFRLHAASDAPRIAAPLTPIAAPAELLSELAALRARSEVDGWRARDGGLKDLERLCLLAEERGWTARGDVAAALGDTSVALGLASEALGHYERALAAADGAAGLRHVERACALRLRIAARVDPAAPLASGVDGAARLADIEAARDRLLGLNAALGSSPHRLALIGRAELRRAALLGGAARTAALKAMADAHAAAAGTGGEGCALQTAETDLAVALLAVTAGRERQPPAAGAGLDDRAGLRGARAARALQLLAEALATDTVAAASEQIVPLYRVMARDGACIAEDGHLDAGAESVEAALERLEVLAEVLAGARSAPRSLPAELLALRDAVRRACMT